MPISPCPLSPSPADPHPSSCSRTHTLTHSTHTHCHTPHSHTALSHSTHTRTRAPTHRPSCKVSPKMVQQLLMALSLGPHNGQRDGVHRSRQEVSTRGHLDFVGGHGCSSGGRRGAQVQAAWGGRTGTPARQGKQTQGDGDGASLPRDRGEAGTSGPGAARSLEKLLPSMGRPEPGRLGRGDVGRGAASRPRASSSRQGGTADRALGWLLTGRLGHALDEGGFRVGEPVQPESGPQGSGGTGLGGAPRSLSA